MIKDRQDLKVVDDNIRNLRIELDYRVSILKEKEDNLDEYDRTISESERTLTRVLIIKKYMTLIFLNILKLVETSQKLTNALESESTYLRGKLKK